MTTDLVQLSEFAVSYRFPVVFTRHLFDTHNHAFVDAVRRVEPAKRHRCLFFVEEAVAAANPNLDRAIRGYLDAHAASLQLVGDLVIMPGGEAAKDTTEIYEQGLDLVRKFGVDRHSYIVAIGGGAFLDVIGYVAATAHRGVRHIRVPTTTLSQCDSGVGVKCAINLSRSKNFIGSFSPPWAVLNDSQFLETLPARERVAGLAEIVKVALIRDAALFGDLEHNVQALAKFDRAQTERAIRRCAELHTRQIVGGGDPFEFGSARPLDFGHWLAHRLESETNYALRHGEAVAIGIAADARYSVLAGLLAEGEDMRIVRLLRTLGFDLRLPELPGAREHLVQAALREFREHLGGELTITLLAGIGEGVEVHAIEEALVLSALRWLDDVAADDERISVAAP